MAATAPNYTAQCVAADQQHVSSMFLGSGSTTIARIATDCVKQNFNPIFLSMGAGFGMNLVSASGLKDHLWEPFQAAPFFATNIPAVQTANAAIDKYFPGVRENANLYNESDFMSWTSGVLLEDAVKAGGLTASATPSAAEVTTGLDSLKGDTLQGLAVPLTFTSGQPHNISCWFTVRVQDGVPKLVNNGQVSCEPASSS